MANRRNGRANAKMPRSLTLTMLSLPLSATGIILIMGHVVGSVSTAGLIAAGLALLLAFPLAIAAVVTAAIDYSKKPSKPAP